MDNSLEQDKHDPMAEALSNSIILETIIKNHSVNVKDVRLVCKAWNQIVISLPKKLKFCVDLIKDKVNEDEPWRNKDNPRDPLELFCPDMEPKLGTRIKMDQTKWTLTAARSILLHVPTQFNDCVKYLELVHIEDGLVPELYEILLQTNNFPNLQGLSISDRRLARDGFALGGGSDQHLIPLPLRTKLISIYLRVHESSTTTSFCILGQLLINCAPNLRRLELSSLHYFPDLTKCPNLVALLLSRGPNLRLVKFDLFSKMLVQVAKHLEVLLIGCQDSMYPKIDHHVERDVFKTDFIMPKTMPRLRTLRIEYIDILQCGDALEDICGRRCPSLQHLILGSYTFTDDLLRNMGNNGTRFSFGNRGVTSLSLEWTRYPASFYQLKNSFPYLKRLEVLSWFGWLKLGALFKACSSLELTHLDVKLKDYPEKLSGFLYCFLNNDKLFKTLKVLSITRTHVTLIRGSNGLDDLKENPRGMYLMKRFVFTMARMQRAVIWYPLCEDVWDRIMPCIKKNNIPLEFKGF